MAFSNTSAFTPWGSIGHVNGRAGQDQSRSPDAFFSKDLLRCFHDRSCDLIRTHLHPSARKRQPDCRY